MVIKVEDYMLICIKNHLLTNHVSQVTGTCIKQVLLITFEEAYEMYQSTSDEDKLKIIEQCKSSEINKILDF